jgi:hypothetical protein
VESATADGVTLDDLDREDEGWIWLPWEELEELQKQKNAMLRAMMDSAALAGSVIYVWFYTDAENRRKYIPARD